MATAYKYVKREPTDNINWAEVGADFSNMLQEEMAVRQQKKDAIDQATREYQKVLNNVPQGENTDLNGMALGFADDLQKQMLMQETLLKSGQLDPRQYTIMRQNLADGTDQGFGLLQDYNDEYSKKMAMLDPNLPVSEQLSAIDLEIMGNVEGFANFNDAKLIINPQTGLVSMAKMIKDPDNPDGALIPDPDPNNLVSVQNLKNRIKTNITKYDVVGNAQKWTETLGKEVMSVVETMGTTLSAGTIRKVEDITSRGLVRPGMTPEEKQALADDIGITVKQLESYNSFRQAQNNWADCQINDENFSGASILMDFANFTPDGKEYKTTFNPKDVYVNGKDGTRIKGAENIILLETVNGKTQTVLSDEQREVAKTVLKSQVGVQVDYESTVDSEFMKKEARPKNPSEIERGDLEKKQNNVFSNVAKLYYGDNDEVMEAINFLRSTNPDITDIDRAGEDVIIRYSDGNQETITFGDQGQQQWVEGATNFFLSEDDKISDINQVSKRVRLDPDRQLNTTSVGYGGQEFEEKEDLLPAYQRKLEESAPAASSILKPDDENNSDTRLQTYVTSLPGLSQFTVAQTGGGVTDELVIKNAEGEEITSINLDLSTYGTQAKFNDAMEAFMKSLHNLSADQLSMEDMALQVQGSRQTTRRTRGTLRGGNNNNNNNNNSNNNDRSRYNNSSGG